METEQPADAGESADALDLTADAQLQPPELDDRRKAYAERDRAKAAARKLEAERDAARAALDAVNSAAEHVREAKISEALRYVDPTQHGAARAVVQVSGLDPLLASPGDIEAALRAAGLLRPRAGIPGTPGINMATKAEDERPMTREDAVRETARRLSSRGDPAAELAAMRERAYQRGRAAPTATPESVAATAKALANPPATDPRGKVTWGRPGGGGK